ncbi:MAG TPA: APC family permease [Solirubrobacteraceae bacterium]|nr:APC family permease [Solirubrobacteraceae bacterium]
MPEAIEGLAEVAEAEGAGPPTGGADLGHPALKLRHAVAQSLGLGPMISAGVLLGLIASPVSGAGVNATFSVLMATIGCLGLGYAVSLFARRWAGAGSLYEFLARGATARFGVLAAGVYFIGLMWAGGPSLGSGFATVVQPFLDNRLSIHVTWWVIMLVGAGLVQALNFLGIRLATRVMLYIAGFGLIPMLILAVTILAKGGADGLTLSPFNPGTTSIGTALNGILIGVTLFVGFEAAAALGEECEHPHRDIPRAVLLSLLAAGAFYVLMTYVLTMGYGTAAVAHGAWANDPAYLDTMANRYVGSWLATILDLVVISDAFAAMLMFCVVVGHGLFSLARDGLLPKVFATTSRYNTPWVSNSMMFVAMVVGMIAIPVLGYAKTFGLPNDTFAILSLTTTTGSYLIQIIYFAMVLVAFRLVYSMRGRPGQWWRYLVVLIGASVPVLAYKGTLIPVPSDLGTSVNYVAFFYAIAMAILVLLWYLYLSRRLPDRLDRAAEHVATAEPVEIMRHGQAPAVPPGTIVGG